MDLSDIKRLLFEACTCANSDYLTEKRSGLRIRDDSSVSFTNHVKKGSGTLRDIVDAACLCGRSNHSKLVKKEF
jgi:hypothetical protein